MTAAASPYHRITASPYRLLSLLTSLSDPALIGRNAGGCSSAAAQRLWVMMIRERVIQAVIERFGEPDVTIRDHGKIYRWKLAREFNLDLHVIIDSPEKTYEGHILVSDPCPWVAEPLRSMRITEEEEISPALDDIHTQWKLEGCWRRPAESVR